MTSNSCVQFLRQQAQEKPNEESASNDVPTPNSIIIHQLVLSLSLVLNIINHKHILECDIDETVTRKLKERFSREPLEVCQR